MSKTTTRTLAASTLAATLALLAAPAHAEECSGWFCDEAVATPAAPEAPAPTAGASAAPVAPGTPGTIMLPGGESISGTITELVPGDHVTVRTPWGVSLRLSWSLVAGVKVGGSVSVGGSSAPAPAAAPPPAPARPPIAAAPVAPPTAWSAPPPATTWAPPPASYPRYRGCPGGDCPYGSGRGVRDHASGWVLGARVSVLGATGDSDFGGGYGRIGDYVGTGVGIEASIGYRFAHNWTPYVSYQLAGFGTGNSNSGTSGDVLGHLVMAGMRLDTNPRGLGVLLDAGIGYRWLSVPMGGGNVPAFHGAYPVRGSFGQSNTLFEGLTARGGAGLAFGGPRLRWDLLVDLAIGSFDKVSGGNSCSSYAYCGSLSNGSQSSYVFAGLSLGGRFGL